jgi:O-antigen/teichoic acid export membrane protein
MSLFISIKRLIKHSAIYGLGHIINRSLGFLLLPLYTNVFSSEAFGVAGVMMTYLTIFTLVYVYGLDAGFLRYYIAAETLAEKKSVFSTTFATLVCSTLAFSTLFWLAAPFLSRLFFAGTTLSGLDLILLLKLVSGILLFDTISFIPLLILRAEEKSISFIFFKISNVVLNIAANVYFIFGLHLGVAGIFWANLVSSVFTFIMTIPLLIRYGVPVFSAPLLKRIFLFGLPALPSGAAVVLMDTIDRVFLERLSSLQSVGLYNSGSKLGMSMALFVAAFRFAWPPYLLAVAKEPNAKLVYSRVLTYLLVACAAVFLFISFFVNPISHLSIGQYHLIAPEYWPANAIVPVIMLAYIMYATYLNFYAGVYLHDKTVYIIWSTLAGLLVNLAANRLLVPEMNIMGAAWARFLSYLTMACVLYYFSQKLYPISYEWKRLAIVTITTALLYAVGQTSWVQRRIGLGVLLLVAYPFLLWSMGFFHREELNKIKILFEKR